jgi:CO/xanthine dehydrogenase Mo-binding subunit
MLHAAFFRSPHAHAKLTRLDASKARAAPASARTDYADLRPHLALDRIPLRCPPARSVLLSIPMCWRMTS